MRGYASVWRDTQGLPDKQVAEMIRADGIDILVDLTMHMSNSRALMFAQARAGADRVAGISRDDWIERHGLPA